MADIIQYKRKSPRREIICCASDYLMGRDEEKGRYIRGGQRMPVQVCAKRSQDKKNKHCFKCKEWINNLKEMK